MKFNKYLSKIIYTNLILKNFNSVMSTFKLFEGFEVNMEDGEPKEHFYIGELVPERIPDSYCLQDYTQNRHCLNPIHNFLPGRPT